MSIASNVQCAPITSGLPASDSAQSRGLNVWLCCLNSHLGTHHCASVAAQVYGLKRRLPPSPTSRTHSPSEMPLCFEGAIRLSLRYHRLAIGVERIIDNRLLLQHRMVIA